jgi:hypothetical protein
LRSGKPFGRFGRVDKTGTSLGSSVVPNSHPLEEHMVFESVRGYVQLASGLTELTRARATEAANGLLSLQGAGMESGSKLAVQVSALAEELLAAATANRHNLTALVRSEVDSAVNRIGLVPAEQLQESQAEVAALRAELAALKASSSGRTSAKKAATKKSATKKSATKKAATKKAATKKAATKKAATNKAATNKAATNKAATKKSPAKRTATTTTSAVSAGGNPATMAAETQPSAATIPDKPADV